MGTDTLLTVKEAAARLTVSTATVYSLRASGRLAHMRISTYAIRIAEGACACRTRASPGGG